MPMEVLCVNVGDLNSGHHAVQQAGHQWSHLLIPYGSVSLSLTCGCLDADTEHTRVPAGSKEMLLFLINMWLFHKIMCFIMTFS